MTWGWESRGPLPAYASATGTTAGGSIGSKAEAAATKAWPRYEAEYLKRALQSEQYKYDTDGLDEAQKGVYLDKVVSNYKSEADECLKTEFEDWLQGQHECNDTENEHLYENADGKPVRRWVMRTPESEDNVGGYKIGQARAGWKHTPWGRAPLTHLPGVREYLRELKESANDKDLQMQMLAEFGPQNIEQAFMYFKHWVKGRPLSDAVALPARFTEPNTARTFFDHVPDRMYAYDSVPSDRQPGVLASDPNARDAAVALPGDKPVTITSEAEDKNVQETRELRERMQELVRTYGVGQQKDYPQREVERREERAEVREQMESEQDEQEGVRLRARQQLRQEEQSAPTLQIAPKI